MQTIRPAILLIRDSTTGAGTELLLSEVANKGVPWKKMFVETSQNSQENTCAKVSFFNKVAGLRSATLLKKRLWHRCFPVNFKLFIYNIFFSFILVFLTSFFVIVSYLEVAACRCSSKCFSKFRKIHRNNLMLDCLILIKLQAWISATLSKKKMTPK